VNLIIVGCSRRKRATVTPVPALDLYEGWCVPALRAEIAGRSDRLAHVRVLSARHGLIAATTPLLPYDQVLTRRRALRLRRAVRQAFRDELSRGDGSDLLLLLEPRYLRLLGRPDARHPPRAVHWFSHPVRDWGQVHAHLAGWGWQ